MGRDPRRAALAAVWRTRERVSRLDAQLAKARRSYRESMLAAKAQGCTNAEMARALGTSESRVRQEIARGVEEAISEQSLPPSA